MRCDADGGRRLELRRRELAATVSMLDDGQSWHCATSLQHKRRRRTSGGDSQQIWPSCGAETRPVLDLLTVLRASRWTKRRSEFVFPRIASRLCLLSAVATARHFRQAEGVGENCCKGWQDGASGIPFAGDLAVVTRTGIRHRIKLDFMC